jgi:hypothetical protein
LEEISQGTVLLPRTHNSSAAKASATLLQFLQKKSKKNHQLIHTHEKQWKEVETKLGRAAYLIEPGPSVRKSAH